MNLRTPTLVTLVLCAPYLCADEPTPEEIADAGARYQKNCMACHQPPDLRFETDRAWVSRIRETA